MTTSWKLVPCAAIALLAGPAAAAAQVAGAGVSFERYGFGSADAVGIESVSLIAIPFAASAPLGRRVTLELAGAWASGELTRVDGSAATLSALTDTELRARVRVSDRFTLTGAYALPTGHATHTLDEFDVAGAIASDLLPFRISNWGGGGGGRIGAALALPVGEFGMGLSASYGVPRSFEPLVDEPREYVPANELALRLAVDRSLTRASRLTLQLGTFLYADEALGGQDVYRPGNRFFGLASLGFPAGRTASAAVYGGAMHRGAGELLQDSLSAGDPVAEDLVLAGFALRMPAGRATLTPAIDARLLRREDGHGQGYMAGIGGSAGIPGSTVTWVPTLRARFGNVVVSEGVESGFLGWEVALSARFGRVRR
jgi:hypothetical protein